MHRILAVTDDPMEWQALTQELGAHFELVRAMGHDQAYALIEREPGLLAVVSYAAPLATGAELMRGVMARKPNLPRVLIAETPTSPEALALVTAGVVRAVVANPAAVLRAFGAPAPPPPQHPLRTEPRTPVKAQLPVSTSAWEGFLDLHTKDASRGGVFFFFAQRVVPTSGTKCRVRLGDTLVDGTVAHVMSARLATATNTDAGFGVSFAAPQPPDWWKPFVAQAAVVAPASATPAGGVRIPSAKELEGAKNFFNLAIGLYDERNYAAAKAKFELAGRMAPDNRCEAMQAVCSGQQYARSGLSDKAKDALNRALQLDPDCAQAKAALKLLK